MLSLPAFKQLFSESYQLFLLKWRRLLLIQIFATGLIVVLAAIFGFLMSSGFIGGATIVPMIILAIALVVAILFLSAWMATAQLIVITSESFSSWKQLFAEARPWVWKYLLTMLLMQLLLVLLGVLVIIPAIIFGVYWSLALPVFIKEGVWGMAALRRSKELVTGRWKTVFLRWLFVVGISLLIMIGFSLLSAALNAEENEVMAAVFGVIQVILSFVWSNLMMIYGFVLYRYLRNPEKATV